MDQSAYASMSALEDRHWWFVGRRRIIASLIETLALPRPGARVLEAGCGTGGNLALLARYGQLDAFEFNDGARAAAESKNITPICFGALPAQVNFPPGTYDLVALLDVLEHIEDDEASLSSLGAVLNAGGRLLVTVPAMPSLWSSHDEIHHHYRRYTRQTLIECIEKAGLRVERIGYFNSLLFPLAWFQRKIQRMTGREMRADAMPGKLANALLTSVFALERHLIGRIRFPVGLSLFAVVSRA